MHLNTMPQPEKQKGSRTPSRQLKKKKKRRPNTCLFDKPPWEHASFPACETTPCPGEDALNASCDSLASPAVETTKRITPHNPKKYIVPGRPAKVRSMTLPSRLHHRFPFKTSTFPGSLSPVISPRLRNRSPPRHASPMPQKQSGKALRHWKDSDYDALVSDMSKKGVRLLALDWDLTVISLHTNSQWFGPATELAKFIRKPFRKLINAAIKISLPVAVCTFSEQTDLICLTLKCAFPKAPPIPVFGNGGDSWKCCDGMMNSFYRAGWCRQGKLPHVCAAAADVDEQFPAKLPMSTNEVVLVDDDMNNVKIARLHKIRSFFLQPEYPDPTFLLLQRTV